MNKCFQAGMSGLCGPECNGFLDGECENADTIFEIMCEEKMCYRCISCELAETYDFNCKLSNDVKDLIFKITDLEYDMNSDYRSVISELMQFSKKKKQILIDEVILGKNNIDEIVNYP